ncbi:MAG TPA: hypothetical protein H9687_01195 [Firmicutes bacterium]|nr:hypothetical protein [Bacillota bacterium]
MRQKEEWTSDKGDYINPKQRKLAQTLLGQEFDGDLEAACAQTGIGMGVLYKWLGEEPFRKYLQEQMEKRTYGEMPAVWRALMQQCVKGNVTAIKLYFELQNRNKTSGTGVKIVDDIGAGETHG